MMEPIYRPQHKDEDALIEDFVIRHREYEQIMDSIESDRPGEAPQHIILQGVRGMGKTTLMYRAYYELMNHYRENGIIPVIFSEEQYSVRTLYKLWEEIALYLEENEPSYAGILQRMEKLEGTDEVYEEQAFSLLKAELEQKDHRLILFIDNFGVMVDKFKKRDQQRLREILIEFSRIKIIGGSAVVLESFYRYDKPFFEFFKVIQLDKLDLQEVQTMLRMLGARHGNPDVESIIQNQPGRVESLRILTNGVPRTIVLLFHIFLDNMNGNSIDDLKQLLDQVTPLYQQRMENLPPQQQEIVEKLALSWDGMAVSELKQKTRMSSRAISAQLNNLEKSQIITGTKSSNKNKIYQLEERFFNIWYLMHHAPKSYKRKVIWLTRFLELWCGEDHLKKHIEQFEERLKQEAVHPEYALSMVYAYAQAKDLPRRHRDSLIHTAQDSLKNSNKDFAHYLPDTMEALADKLEELINHGCFDDAKSTIERAAIPESTSQYFLGIVSQEAQEYQEAEKHYQQAIEHDNIYAMYNLALLYKEQERFDEAEKYYLKAIDNGEGNAMYNLALLYHTQERFDEAEGYYLKAIDKGDIDAMNNLAILYKNQGRIENAETYYLKAIDKGDIDAMNNLAVLYQHKERFEEAETYYLKAIDKGVIEAMFNLAILYEYHKRHEEAEKYYKIAIKNNHQKAVINLINLHIQYNHYKKIPEIKSIIEISLNKTENYLLKLVTVRFLIWADEPGEAIAYFKRILPEVIDDERYVNQLTDVLAFAVAKGLHQTVFKLFNNESYQLKDRLKVLYYALMTIMESEYPNEIRKMGKELEEPVENMVHYIRQLEAKYQ